MANTPTRPFRIPDDVYDAAKIKAEFEGRTLTDVVMGALRRYVGRPPYICPDCDGTGNSGNFVNGEPLYCGTRSGDGQITRPPRS